MPRRKTPRLAYCEYVIPDPKGSVAVWIARLDLMRAVKRVYPSMLERLSADVFPAYAELAQSGFEFDALLWHPRVSPHRMIPDACRLKSALRHWANSFHADAEWFLDETLRTLRGWYVAPDWRRSLKWNPISGVSSTRATGERFQFDCEGWEMQLLTWAAYSQSVRKRFEQKLAEYEAASRKNAESCGLVRAPQKYSPSNFDWFVLYQFAGLSSTQIVGRATRQNPDIDESTVLKGVKAAAKLAGWGQLRKVETRARRKIR